MLIFADWEGVGVQKGPKYADVILEQPFIYAYFCSSHTFKIILLYFIIIYLNYISFINFTYNEAGLILNIFSMLSIVFLEFSSQSHANQQSF